jgi:starvation-inducible DNA-binding protein
MAYASRRNFPAAAQVLPILQARLSDTLDLQTRVKQAHWTVQGVSFIALHDLLDRMAEDIASASDDIAERIMALGGLADGRLATTLAASGLPQRLPLARDQGEILDALATAFAVHGMALRQATDRTAELGDAGTADLFTGQSRQADKHLWLIEAHLPQVRSA